MTEIKIDKMVRSKRRTLALVITQDAQLVVRAPFKMPAGFIESFISKKSAWIKTKQETARVRCDRVNPKQFVDGEEFLYLGRQYQFKIVEKNNIALNGFLEFPKHLLPQARVKLVEWYKAQVTKVISERARFYSGITGLRYNSIRITSAERILGSCGHKAMLNFSWRLIMAPLRVIDYLVVHELVHIEEKNHAKRFWDRVRALMPDYTQQKKWLKQNGHLLRI